MKKIIYFFIAALFVTSCASTKNSKGTTIDGTWELSAFPGSPKSFDEVFSQRRPQLQFNSSKATVTGTTGCNRLTGTYTSSADNFSFGENIVTTKMACMDYDESVFLQALHRVNRFEMTNGQLKLLQNNEMIMAFTKRP